MLKFIIKVVLFSLVVSLSTAFVLNKYSSNFVDERYNKIASPQTDALVLGSSRAQRGMVPSLIAKNTGFDHSMFNFAFTLSNSPYGEIYRSAIQQKLKPGNKGLFVIEVNPFLIGVDTTLKELVEKNKTLDNLYFMNFSPNYEYMVKKSDKPLYKVILKNDTSNNEIIHKDGWVEKFNKWDEKKVKENIKKGIKEYNKQAKKIRLSDYRIESLKEIIDMLKQHGEVYLVRLPVSCDMLELENKYYPGFDSIITKISSDYKIPYFDYTNIDCRTGDSHHLSVQGAIKISEIINKDILKHQRISGI